MSEKKEKDEIRTYNPSDAYLGGNIWDSTIPLDFEDNFELEYLDIEDFMSENEIANANDRGLIRNVNPPMPSPMYKEPEDPPMLDMEPEARGKTPREQMKGKRRGFAQFRVRNPGLVIKNKR